MFDRGVEGRVVVQAMVDSTGRVESGSIEVVRATRFEFERPAIDMVQHSRFSPARTDGRTLRRLVRVPVRFDLEGRLRVTAADSAAAAARALAGETLARQGDIINALTAYSEALGLNVELNGSHQFWRGVCWHGTLGGNAAEVIFACDQAVALEPDAASTRDARGLARAMIGDYAGAMEDLEQSAARATTTEARDERLSWIATLRSGQNPFTEEVLRTLRGRRN
jgi:TonB family protein